MSLKPAKDNLHKYEVVLKCNGTLEHVKFGLKGASDYTQHKDEKRMERYLVRHQKREDWTISGILSAGFWSRWILWNKPSFYDAVDDVISRFKL